MFTEEFQVEFMREYFKGFDKLRGEFFVGEMPWNFADFMTKQGKMQGISVTILGIEPPILSRSKCTFRRRFYSLLKKHVYGSN